MSSGQLERLGRFRIVGEIGRGAMGVVYKAEDPSLNRTVAIKTIFMSADPEERAEYEARFQQEARAAGGLNHPNIVTVHDIGREGELAYMAMELMEGVDLRDLMRRGHLPVSLALDIAAQVADGLAFAHERGVVHRDIKPANIMIVRARQAKIMDFGIARTRLSDVKTQTGAILGSPKYMSPEQLAGQRADHRSDIFSLGVTIYEMVTGASPFSAAELGQLMLQVSTAAPPPASSINPALPTMMDLILAKALEKDPAARYQSARELASDLVACTGQLNEQAAAPQGAAGAAAVDLTLEKTVKSTAAILQAPGSLQLSLSRRFDSVEALQRLEQPTAVAGATRGIVSDARRFLQDPYQRSVAIALAVAMVVAGAIALS